MEPEDLLHSPRSRSGSICVWGPDTTAVRIEEDEVKGAFLRMSRPARHGEAILVEEALFLSPADDEELGMLLELTCSPEALASASAGPPPAPGSLGPESLASACHPPGAAWLPVIAQLCIVVARALLHEAPGCDEFRELRGDEAHWSGAADWVYALLSEAVQSQLTKQAFCEVYSIIATNALAAEDGRAGVFRLGSCAEHSCMPSAFKEVLVPMEPVCSRSPNSRGGSPSGPAERGDAADPPSSPSRSMVASAHPPQLVLRAHRDLDEGDVVSISYVSEYLPTWRRRELLQAGYAFVCRCDRCEHSPEVVCAFWCPKCGGGPCSPTGPVLAEEGGFPSSGLRGQKVSCEACEALIEEDAELDALGAAELSEALSEDVMRVLHPFHHKVYSAYLSNLQVYEVGSRAKVLERLIDAVQRLAIHEVHPLLGRLCELAAEAYQEAGDKDQALACYKRAQTLYGSSHRGPPDPGHETRCHASQQSITGGPLGAAPRALRKLLTRCVSINAQPHLPSVTEVEAAEAEARPGCE